jgi:predicted GIY-YIG superfamily endonuclease
MSKPISDAQYRYLKLALNDPEREIAAAVYINEYCNDPLDLTRQQAYLVISALEEKYNPDALAYYDPKPSDIYEPEAQVLYRLFDEASELLYVGVSKNALARMDQHQLDKPWFTDVALVKFEHFPSREAVLEAERLAILTERPKYNQQHSGQTIDNHLTELPMLEDHQDLYRSVQHDMANHIKRQGPEIWGSSWIAQGYLYSVGEWVNHLVQDGNDWCPACAKIAKSKRWKQVASEYDEWLERRV